MIDYNNSWEKIISQEASFLRPCTVFHVTEQASTEYQAHGKKKNASVIMYRFSLELERAETVHISHVGFAHLP